MMGGRASFFALTLVGIFFATLPAEGQVPDSIIRRLMDEYSVPGLSMAVVDGDSTSLYGWGRASVGPEEAVTPDTPFRIASVAKSLVATTVLLEASGRGLDLHGDVAPLVGFPFTGNQTAPITLHHLLTHTAGFDERMVGYAARSSEEMLPLGEYLEARMPERGWAPGEIVSYSNHGMSLAAYAVERAAGMSFAQVARSSLFAPLGMDQTLFLEGGTPIPPTAAQPLLCDDSGCTSRPHLFSHTYPAGLAFSTARDMGSFINAILEAGNQGGPLGEVIPERFSHDPRLPGMSYGFFNQRYGGHRVLAHSGSAGGYWSLLLLVPEARVGFFISANGGSSRFGEIIRDGLLPILLGKSSESEANQRSVENPAARSGSYELTRYSHNTVERLPQLFHNSIRLVATGDTLYVYSGGGPEAFVQVDDSLYQAVEGEERMAFGTRGGVPYLFRSSDVYGALLPAAYEKRRSFESPRFMNEYLSWLSVFPVILIGLLWPALSGFSLWRRRRRGEESSGIRLIPLVVSLLTTLSAFLFGWFGFGFVARSLRLLETGEMLYGMPQALEAILWIPHAHLALTGFLVLALPAAWKGKWWGLPRRLTFTLMVGGLLLQVAFLIQWNYLPAAW